MGLCPRTPLLGSRDPCSGARVPEVLLGGDDIEVSAFGSSAGVARAKEVERAEDQDQEGEWRAIVSVGHVGIVGLGVVSEAGDAAEGFAQKRAEN